jgi:hypothetical protein
MTLHRAAAAPLLLPLLLASVANAPAAPAAPAEEPAAVDEADVRALEDLVAKATPIVEKARGLAFKSKVAVAPVTQDAFVNRFMADFTKYLGGEERVAPASRLLARLRILPEGGDLRALLAEFLKGNVAANYDPSTKRVSFLPGIPRTLPLMVHELTHALDDQHFDMTKAMDAMSGNLDRALAYGMLAEGDAQSVETRFVTGGASAKIDLPVMRASADAMGDAILKRRFGNTPPAIALAFKSQYTEGVIFAETLRRTEKGEEAIHAAFRVPPASTEQGLHPEKYVAGEGPVAIAFGAPPKDGKVLFETTLGELGTRIALLAAGVAKPDATSVAAGWGGDRVALISLPGGEALVWTTVWDTEADAIAFYECMKTAFPTNTGKDSAVSTRGLVHDKDRVDFVEAPLDAHEGAVLWSKTASR